MNLVVLLSIAAISGVRRKFPRGAKVSSQSREVTNQLGECQRHDHYRVVQGHAPEKFCKITPKNTHFCTGQIGSFSKTKKRSHMLRNPGRTPNTCEKPAVLLLKLSGGYSNSGARGKNFQKLMFSRKKRALISSFTFFSQHHGDL